MIRNSFPRRTLLLVAIATLLAQAACLFSSAGGSQVDPEAEGDTAPSGDGAALQCEIEGYPCSFAEAEPGVLERSAGALDEAAAILDESGSMEAAADMLRSRDDLAEVLYDFEALVFRLEGAPEMWLFNGAALAPGSKSPSASHAGPAIADIDLSGSTLELLQDDGPIGESQSGVEPIKKALILSPFWWDFGEDETRDLAALIRGAHRNYSCDECEVVWKHNTVRERGEDETPEEYLLTRTLSLNFEVSLTDFASWEDYDLVHVSSHGKQICHEGKCFAVMMTGRFLTKPEWTKAGVPDFDVTGVSWGRTAVPGCGKLDDNLESGNLSDGEWDADYELWLNKGCATYTDRWWQGIRPDFFKAAYKRKPLNDKLIFLNSCQSMKDLNLAKSIAGDNTTVLGWTEVVDVGAAGDVALEFYKLYVANGLRAEPAFETVKRVLEPRFQSPALRGFRPKGIEIDELVPPDWLNQGDENTRGREIISLMQPVDRHELMERGAVPTMGVPGDGQPDQILLLVQIDGIDESQDPGAFEIHFVADGQELSQTIRPQEQINDYSYWALGLLDLPFDAARSRYIKLESWVELPEGGQSRHVLEEVELANCGWQATMSGGRSGQIKGDITFPTSTISSATAEELAALAAGGMLGPDEASDSGIPTPGELASLPPSYMLGNRDQFPFMFLIPGQTAALMFEGSSFSFGEQPSVNNREESAERIEGTFSATMLEMTSRQEFSVEGQYSWHQASLCSLDVIGELAKNPFPASMVPAELNQ